MGMVAVTINLPEELVKRANDEDFLNDETIAKLIEEGLERQRQAKLDQFFENIHRLQALEPRITPEEIDAEVAAYRAEKAAEQAAKQTK